MLKTLMTIGSLACVLSLTCMGRAQALPTATGRGAVQAGIGYTVATPDYGQFRIQGISGFADLDLGMHWGVEGDIHYVAIITPADIAENSYLIGPRFIYPVKQRYKFYAKGMIGIGDLVVQEWQDNIGHPAGIQFAYAFGAGLDIQASKHIVIRPVDVEYQHWSYQNGLTPFVYTAGVAWKFR
jgi:hypothetical protein